MFNKITEAHANVLTAIAANEGEEEAQKAFNASVDEATQAYDQQLEDHKETVQGHETRIAELTASEAKANQTIADLQTQVTELNGQIETQSTELETANARITELEAANKELSEATDAKPVEVETSVTEADLVPENLTADQKYERLLRKVSQKPQQN